MVVDLAATQNRKAADNIFEELQEATIPWPINAGRPRNRHVDAEPIAGLPRQTLPLELCHLIEVARPERCVLVGRWMLDVAVDAHGTAVDDASDAGARRAFDQAADRCRVYGAVRVSRDGSRSIDRRDVVDNLDARHGCGHHGGIPQIANRQLDTARVKIARAGRVTDQRANVVSAGRERARQMAAGEPRCAGYEDTHRSAQSVTGEPKSRSRPTRSRTSSENSVNRRDPIALLNRIGSTNCRCTERTRNPERFRARAIVRSVNTR